MLKLAQISDIHIGGEYNGKYKVKENFEKVIKSIPKDTNMVIITGDIADDNYEENYKYVRDFIDDNLKGIDYVVLGGNHDDMDILRKVFSNNSFDENVVNIDFINERTVLTFVDTSNGFLSKEDIKSIPNNSIIFTHYPLIKIHHEFMSNYALVNLNDVEELFKDRKVFCGHFHCSYSSSSTNITPSTQCQINQDNKVFTPIITCGYRLIGLNNGEIISNEVIWID